jgi:hypothetical protein
MPGDLTTNLMGPTGDLQAMRLLAVTFLVVATALAGCSGEPAPPEAEDDGARQSDDRDTTVATWAATGCEEVLLESYVPAELVQPLVPARHEVREFVPGVAIVGAAVSSCTTLALEDATVLQDVHQARLEVLLKGGLSWFVFEWIVDDAVLAAALEEQGFAVVLGEVVASTPAIGLRGMTETRISGADGGRATFAWMPSANDARAASEDRFIQDVGGRDVEVAIGMDMTFSGSFEDACRHEVQDGLWRSVFLAAARECLPFHIPQTSLAYRFQGAAP